MVKSNDKKRARLEAMRFVLARFDYPDKDHEVVGTPDPLIVGPAAAFLEEGERASGSSPPCDPPWSGVTPEMQPGRTLAGPACPCRWR